MVSVVVWDRFRNTLECTQPNFEFHVTQEGSANGLKTGERRHQMESRFQMKDKCSPSPGSIAGGKDMRPKGGCDWRRDFSDVVCVRIQYATRCFETLCVTWLGSELGPQIGDAEWYFKSSLAVRTLGSLEVRNW